MYEQCLGGLRIIANGAYVGWLMTSIDGKYVVEIEGVKSPLCENIEVAKKLANALINEV